MENFLDKLKKSLESGKVDSDLTQHIKTVEEKSHEIKNPEKVVEERLKKAGKIQLTSDQQKQLDDYNKKAWDDIKKEDEKDADLALIENMKHEILVEKVESAKDINKYEKKIEELKLSIEKRKTESQKKIEELSNRIIELTENFKIKYYELRRCN